MKKHYAIGVVATSFLFSVVGAANFSYAQMAPLVFEINDRVVTTASLNVRSSPSASSVLLATEPLGAMGAVAGTTSAEGYVWIQVIYDDGVIGWSVRDYLQKTNTQPAFQLSTRVTLDGQGGSNVELKISPSLVAARASWNYADSWWRISDGPVKADGYTWWKLYHISNGQQALGGLLDGPEGWVRQEFLRKVEQPIEQFPGDCAPATNAFRACYYLGVAKDMVGQLRTLQNWSVLTLSPVMFSRVEPAVNLQWGIQGIGGWVIPPSVPIDPRLVGDISDVYKVLWQGRFTFEEGLYNFTASASDGIRIYVDGLPILDGWYAWGSRSIGAKHPVSAGSHVVTVEYGHLVSDGGLAIVSWDKVAPPPPLVSMSIPFSLGGIVSGKSVPIDVHTRFEHENTIENPRTFGLYVDGVFQASTSLLNDRAAYGISGLYNSAPYRILWDTTKFADGPHTLYVVACCVEGYAPVSVPIPAGGNNAYSNTLNVTIANQGVSQNAPFGSLRDIVPVPADWLLADFGRTATGVFSLRDDRDYGPGQCSDSDYSSCAWDHGGEFICGVAASDWRANHSLVCNWSVNAKAKGFALVGEKWTADDRLDEGGPVMCNNSADDPYGPPYGMMVGISKSGENAGGPSDQGTADRALCQAVQLPAGAQWGYAEVLKPVAPFDFSSAAYCPAGSFAVGGRDLEGKNDAWDAIFCAPIIQKFTSVSPMPSDLAPKNFTVGDRVGNTGRVEVSAVSAAGQHYSYNSVVWTNPYSPTTKKSTPYQFTGTIVGGPVKADKYTWWQIAWDQVVYDTNGVLTVNLPSNTGWTAEEHLKRISFNLGERVRTTISAEVRQVPTISGTILSTRVSGSAGMLIAGPAFTAGAKPYQEFWKVKLDSGSTGWILRSSLEKLPTLDIVAPLVSITAPASYQSVSETVQIAATASDSVGLSKIELYVDGVLQTTWNVSTISFGGDSPPPTLVNYSWNTVAVLNGQRILSAKAYDAAGNVGVSANVNVTVANPSIIVPPPPPPILTPPRHEGTIVAQGTKGTSLNVTGISTGPNSLYLASVAIYGGTNVQVSSISGGGLMWTRVKRQCSGRISQPWMETWKATGSPMSVFTATAILSAAPSRWSAAVSRYTGADMTNPIEGITGSNTKGLNTTCPNDGTGIDTAATALALTSSQSNSVLYAATHTRNKNVSTPAASFTQRAFVLNTSGGDGANLYVHDRTMVTAGTTGISHSLNTSTDWDTIGAVIRPVGSTGTTPPPPPPPPTPTPTPPPPPPAPAPSSTLTFGYPTIGVNTDGGVSNYMTAVRYQTGAQGGTATSISIYVGSPIGLSPNNQFQGALYADASGAPGSRIAMSASKTLVGNAWNTVPITATLASNTYYWIVYNTNGISSSRNSLRFNSGGTSGQTRWKPRTFGTWPSSFGSAEGSSSRRTSMYVTYVVATAMASPAPVAMPTAPSGGFLGTVGNFFNWLFR